MVDINEILTIEEKLKRYAELKAEEKIIAEGIETLKPFIKEHIEGLGVDKLPTTLGTFTLSPRSTWKYSPAVEELQKEEKAKGIAKQVTTNTLVFKPEVTTEE